jgi:hypothetical protein
MFEKSLGYLEMKLIGQVIAAGVGERGEILNHPNRLHEGFEFGRKAVRENLPILSDGFIRNLRL